MCYWKQGGPPGAASSRKLCQHCTRRKAGQGEFLIPPGGGGLQRRSTSYVSELTESLAGVRRLVLWNQCQRRNQHNRGRASSGEVGGRAELIFLPDPWNRVSCDSVLILQRSQEKLQSEAAVGLSGQTRSKQPEEDAQQLLWTLNDSPSSVFINQRRTLCCFYSKQVLLYFNMFKAFRNCRYL